MNLSTINQGELVVADILFAEQVGAKRRLALVVSNSSFNQESQDIVILKVTSSENAAPFDVPLKNHETAHQQLKKNSQIMVDFPGTIMKNNIISRVDCVSKEKLDQVKEKMRELYAL